MHGDELQFLFDFKEAGYIEQGSDEEKLLDLMTGIFTRFAATGFVFDINIQHRNKKIL